MRALRAAASLVVVGVLPQVIVAQEPRPRAVCQAIEAPTTWFDSAMVDLMAEHQVPGATVAVVSRGETILVGGYGCADVATGRGVDPARTRFRIASVSKVFVATAAVQLEREGSIDLHTDVNEYLRDLRVPDAFGQPVTMQHLLTHTAGFEERIVGYAARTPQDVEALGPYLARRLPARGWPSGSHTSYSNLGYALAAFVLESVEGKGFDQVVRERILVPVGMDQTDFVKPANPDDGGDLAIGYRCEAEGCEAVARDYRSAYPAGGLLSTGADMARFIVASVGSDSVATRSLLDEAGRAELFRQQFSHHPALPGIAYAFAEGELAGERSLSHTGGIPGFASLLILMPDSRSGVFVGTNGGSSQFGARVRDLIAREMLGAGGISGETGGGVGGEVAGTATMGEIGGRSDLVGSSSEIVGSYRLTRLARSTIENLPTLFAGQLHVTALGGDSVALQGLGEADGTYLPIDTDVWGRVGGTERLAIRRDEGGDVAYLFGPVSFFGGAFPAAFERLSWYDAPGFVNEALSIIVVPLLIFSIIWPVGAGIGAIVRRLRRATRQPRTRPVAPIVTGLAFSVLAVWFTFGFLAVTVRAAETGGGEIVYGMPPSMALLAWVPWVMAALFLGLVVWTVMAWKRGWWGWLGRLCFSAATVAAMLSLLLLIHWSYLPARF